MGYYGSTLLDAGDSKRRSHRQQATYVEWHIHLTRDGTGQHREGDTHRDTIADWMSIAMNLHNSELE